MALPASTASTRITDAEVAKLLFTMRSRILRLCRARGLLGEEDEQDELGVSAFTEAQGLPP